jgi:hypothetical protein
MCIFTRGATAAKMSARSYLEALGIADQIARAPDRSTVGLADSEQTPQSYRTQRANAARWRTGSPLTADDASRSMRQACCRTLHHPSASSVSQ